LILSVENQFAFVDDKSKSLVFPHDSLNQRLQQRTAIIALNLCGLDCQTIASYVDCHISMVNRWIARAEDGKDIYDQKRSGRPTIITENTQLRTIAFYCQHSPLPGCNSWSLRDAEKYLREQPDIIRNMISRSSIQRILASHALRPHRHKYFLQTTDPDFFTKMEPIIDLYLNPPENLYNYDECTCIQALRHLAPDLPAEVDQPVCEDFDYERNGTTDLMAFFSPKNGRVHGECTSNHNTQTLCRVFKGHVETLPSDSIIHYVMDNLNTHFHNDFCQTVAKLSGVSYTSLKTGQERRQ